MFNQMFKPLLALLFLGSCLQLQAAYEITPLPDWVPHLDDHRVEQVASRLRTQRIANIILYDHMSEREVHCYIRKNLKQDPIVNSIRYLELRDYKNFNIHQAYTLKDGKRKDILPSLFLIEGQKTEQIGKEGYDAYTNFSVYTPEMEEDELLIITYSTVGSQPDFQNRLFFCPEISLNNPYAIHLVAMRCSVSTPLKVLSLDGFPIPVIRKKGKHQYLLAMAVNTASAEPGWEFDGANRNFGKSGKKPSLYVSDFTTWDEYGRVYSRIAPGTGDIDELVLRKAEDFMKPEDSRKEQIHKAIQFVKKDILYEDYGLRQAKSPVSVLKLARGDCKSKVGLLLQLFRVMGVEAWPILVHSEGIEPVFLRFPTYGCFDHVILGFESEGETCLVDATDGFLSESSYCRSNFSYGLSIHGEKMDLAPLSKPDGGGVYLTDWVGCPNDQGKVSVKRRLRFGHHYKEINRILKKSGGEKAVLDEWVYQGSWEKVDSANRVDVETSLEGEEILILTESVPWHQFNQRIDHRLGWGNEVKDRATDQFVLPVAEDWCLFPTAFCEDTGGGKVWLPYPYRYVHRFIIPHAQARYFNPDTLSCEGPEMEYARWMVQKEDTLEIFTEFVTFDNQYNRDQRSREVIDFESRLRELARIKLDWLPESDQVLSTEREPLP